MPDRFELEQLVIDDTFINYCFRRNEADIVFWEDYLRRNPGEAATIAEAKELVMGISLMLAEPAVEEPVIVPLMEPERKSSARKIWMAAASVAVVAVAAFFLLQQRAGNSKETAQAAPLVYTTAMAEMKTVRLADSSFVILNAGSVLKVDAGFGRHNRKVCLKGEALFNVKHNADQPFVVRVEAYDVKVLGTVFNVKAYPGEKKSETSLISGKVEICLPHGAPRKTLRPKEKFVISREMEPVPPAGPQSAPPKAPQQTAIMPLLYNRKNVNVETAWSENRLVFEDETFGDMREKLERWFDVNIEFEDKTIEQYRFTATFEKENIIQVMKALQSSYPFRCSIDGKIVRISHQHPRR